MSTYQITITTSDEGNCDLLDGIFDTFDGRFGCQPEFVDVIPGDEVKGLYWVDGVHEARYLTRLLLDDGFAFAVETIPTAADIARLDRPVIMECPSCGLDLGSFDRLADRTLHLDDCTAAGDHLEGDCPARPCPWHDETPEPETEALEERASYAMGEPPASLPLTGLPDGVALMLVDALDAIRRLIAAGAEDAANSALNDFDTALIEAVEDFTPNPTVRL